MKLAIYGYGNLRRGVECAVRQNDDAELIGVFTRRDPATVKTLTGKTKEEIHAAVVEQRKQFEAGEPAAKEAEG